MISLVVSALLFQAAPSLDRYSYPDRGRIDDHLLPLPTLLAEDVRAAYPVLAGRVLDVPAAGEDVLGWSMVFPPFSAETGFSLVRTGEEPRFRVRGARATDRIWNAFEPQMVAWEAEPGVRPLLSAEFAEHVGATVLVERCDAALPAGLAVRFANALNARLVRTRTGLATYERMPVPRAVDDGTTYWFGGVAAGRTLNSPHGPDTARLRAASDAVTDYCFAADEGATADLEAAIVALEESDPR